MYGHRLGLETVAVYPQENICAGECNPLVAGDKWTAHGEALEQCGGFMNEIFVMPSLRSKQCGFKRASIAQDGLATKPVD